MTSLTWISALALMVATPARLHCRDGYSVTADVGCKDHGGVMKASDPKTPATDAIAPTQRAEDTPADRSPYSAFGAPHARTPASKHHKKGPARVTCKDDSTAANEFGCDGHGGLKE